MKLYRGFADEPEEAIPPELRADAPMPALEPVPDAAPEEFASYPVESPPSPRAPSHEDMLRKVFEAQQAHDEGRSKRLSEAAQKDRTAQSQADVREYLRAAFTRKSPQLRNVGNSYSQEAASVGNDGPLSRELALQKVLSAYQQKPEDSELRDAKLKMYLEQAGMYGRANQPKPPVEKAGDPLLEEKRAKLKAETDKLSRPPAVKGEPKARDLPASMVVEMAGFDTAIGAIEDVGLKFNERKMGSLLNKAGKFIRGSDAEAFDAEMGIVRQVVGKILEGGKLQAQDEAKYRALMPIVGEDPKTAAAKVKALADMLRRDKAARSAALADYGFRMPGAKPEATEHPDGSIEVNF